MAELVVRPGGALRGEAIVPGDKSISQRAAIFAAMADGTTEIAGYLDGEDGQNTLKALAKLGAGVEIGEGSVRVTGVGGRGFSDPETVLDLGNSGTGLRLLLGAISGSDAFAALAGDASLSRRPMGRVVEPLRAMGARIDGRRNATLLPICVRGGGLKGIAYDSPVASAQVKSAILLAGLGASGETLVREPQVSRDHTERMLPAFGVDIESGPGWARVQGPRALRSPGRIEVPKDPSSAAFSLVAALIAGDSDVHADGVSINATRIGWVEAIRAMGGDVEIDEAPGGLGSEPVGRIRARTSELRGFELGGELVPRTIDEIPILCAAAVRAHGTTLIRDAAELRVKESDRIAAICGEFAKLGIEAVERPDGLEIAGPQRVRGGVCQSRGDHRIAMTLAVLGLVADGPVTIEDAECIHTSYPGFVQCLAALGADVEWRAG